MRRFYGVLLLILTVVISSIVSSVSLVTAKAATIVAPRATLRNFVPVARVSVTRSKPVTYTVRSGDTLSSIAGKIYGNSRLWPALWWVNKARVRNPNAILIGQVLKLSSWHPQTDWLATAAIHAIPQPVVRLVVKTVAYSNTAPQSIVGTDTNHASGSGFQDAVVSDTDWPGGSFGNCVVERESGGDSQVMNSSGHYGLYQFSDSTWQEYGGSASDFGDASVGEQERVFENALARGGESNWSAYDGC